MVQLQSEKLDSIYKCEAFEFNLSSGNLETPTAKSRLEPTIARLLAYFLTNQHRLIERQELLENVWQGKIVSDDPINRGVSILRQALDSSNRHRFIKTIPRRGYEASFPSPVIDKKPSPETPEAVVTVSEPQQSRQKLRKLNGRKVVALACILLISALAIAILSYQHNLPVNKNSDKPIIAVLPFLDGSEDRERQSIGEGFSDALIGSLSRVQQIQVIARTSSFALEHRDKRASEIAAALDADYLLEGRVSYNNNNMLINARLIDTSNETLVWSSQFQQPKNSVFNVNNEISAATISSIVGSMIAQPVDNYMPSYPAYQQVMLGLQQKNIGTISSLQRAIEHFEMALELDPNYALPLVMMASAINNLNTIDPMLYEYSADEEKLESIDELLNKALSIEPLLPEALALQGRIALRERRYDVAERQLNQSLKLSPSYAMAKADLAQLLFSTNRLEEAILVAREALKLNPQSNSAHQLTARVLWQLGRSEQAVSTIEKNITLNPKASNNYSLLSRWHFQLGKPVKAVVYAAEEWELEPRNPNKQWRLCISLLQVWYWELAEQCTESVLQKHPDYYEARKFQLDLADSEKLEQHIKTQIAKYPNSVYFQLQLAHELNKQGRWKEIVDIISILYPSLSDDLPIINDFNIWGARMLGLALINTDEKAKGERILNNILDHIDASRKLQGGGLSSGVDDVYVLAALGQYDQAIERLNQAIENDWLFYSFDFFRGSGVKALDLLPEFIALKNRQEQKVKTYQKQIDSELSLTFDINS